MRAAIPALILYLLATSLSASEFALSENFDAPGQTKCNLTHGKWIVRDGAHHLSGTGRAYLSEVALGDVSMSVDCCITDYGAMTADWIGVVLGGDGQTGDGKGFLVYIRYSGSVELYHRGEILAVAPTNAQATFEAGEYVRLEVDVRQKHFAVSVNGQTLIEHDAPQYQWGDVALAGYDIEGQFDNLRITGSLMGRSIMGEVFHRPSFRPASGARVDIYNSMDDYDSPVTRSTVADEQGQFVFTDLPPGEKAYWLRASMDGCAGSTAWFITVTEGKPAKVELYLTKAPPHDIWIDSADLADTVGFSQVADPQCFGGDRIEVKKALGPDETPNVRARFEFDVPRGGDHVPHLAAGLYPFSHYWSGFWWFLDDDEPRRASETLAIEGLRYGDRDTMTWAAGPVVQLDAGRHALTLLVRDPAPHDLPGGEKAYWWSFDAAVLTEAPVLLSPEDGELVPAPRPELQWRAGEGLRRFAVQYSSEPDFSNATVTVGGVIARTLRVAPALPDGTYYWRVKPTAGEDTLFTASFTRPRRFTVSTPAPALEGIRIASRAPTEVRIKFRTDEPCTARLRWGLSACGPTRLTPVPASRRRVHGIHLAGLEPMTYYYYWIEATDSEGDSVTSLRRGFCTPRGVIRDKNSPFGMFGQGLTYVKQMAEAGVRWYSDYWSWAAIEPSRGEFSWSEPDDRMKRAEEAGVNLTVTFWGTPAWIRPSHPTEFTYGPDDLQDARDFFREVAAHCKGRTNWWLPWIEPNVAHDPVFGFPTGYWSSRPHAQSYTAYQRAAYEGAKAGDPDCRVVGMNTAGVDMDFIRKCYDEGAADSFDVMNVHYYAVGVPFERQSPERLFADLRALMAQYGDAEKPILCSEGGGASSNVEGASEETQAGNLVRIYVISIANNIDKLCWTFELDVKPYESRRVDMIMWMGLFRFHPDASPDNPCGEPKPAYFALKTMTENLRGTEYAGPVPLGSGIRAYRFVGSDRQVTVAWAEKGQAEARIPVRSATVTIVRRDGERTSREAADGSVSLTLTESPVFVVEQ